MELNEDPSELNEEPSAFYVGLAGFVDEVRAAAEAEPTREIEISAMLDRAEGMMPVSVFLGRKKGECVIAARTLAAVPEPYRDGFGKEIERITFGEITLIGHDCCFPCLPQGAQPGQMLARVELEGDLKTEWPVLVKAVEDICTDLRSGINVVNALMYGESVSEAAEHFFEDAEYRDTYPMEKFVPFPDTPPSSDE